MLWKHAYLVKHAKLFCLLNSLQELEYSLDISFTTSIEKKTLVSLISFAA